LANNDVGLYTLPVILSFEGIDKQVNGTLGKAFGPAGKKATSEFSKGAKDGLKDLESSVEASRKAYDKLKDKASDALGKVRKEEAALQELRDRGVTSGSRFVAIEERLAAARRNSDRAARDSTSGLQELTRAQADLAGHSDRTSGRLAALGSAAGTMGAVAGGAALAGIAALGTGAIVAGRQLYDLGAQFDDLSDTLQVKTGLSGTALDQLKASVEELGTTNVPSAFGEIGDVAAEVTRNLHLTGPAFDDVTSRLANLQRMGVDVDIRALGKAFRGFGVDAAGQAPALNSLYEASTKSGMSIDDMLSAVVKGGPALRQFGLSFGESAALLSSFEDAGLDGEKGMAALTKAFAFFSKENIPAQEGLQRTIAEIQRLGDTPEAGALANKVFGAKGGAQFLEAIQSGALDLQSLSNSLGQTGLDINEVSANTADWSEKWQDLKNKVSVALEPLAGRIFDGVNEELGKASDFIVQHKDEIVDALVELSDATLSAAEVMIKNAGLFTEGLGQIVGGIGNVLGAVNDFEAWQADIRGDTDTAAKLRAQAQEFYGWGEKMQEFGHAAAGIDFDGLRDSIHNIGNEAKGSSDPVGHLGDSVKTLGDNINGLPANLPGWFPNLTGGGAPPTSPGWFGGFTQGGSGLPPTALAPGSVPSLDDIAATGGGGRGVGINLQVNAQSSQSGQYGLPKGTNTGGYGTGNAATFPPWVMALADQFGVKPSTYSGHQETDRKEAGFAPNPGHENRGIDWSGSVENMQKFADYLATIPGALEQVIWQNPNTGQTDTIAGGKPVSGYYDAGTLADHQNHVHTRQSAPIPTAGTTVALSGSYAQAPMAGADWDTMAQGESHGDWAANTGNGFFGGLQFTQSSWEAAGGLQYAQRADLATPDQQKAVAEKLLAMQGPGAWPKTFTPATAGSTQSLALGPGGSSGLNNAFGADYKPGVGTPGYNEYGDPGYYETDPRQIAQANRGVEDSQRRIKDADQAVKDAEAKKEELDALASQDDRDKAERDVEKARDDAKRAREDAQWAKEDLDKAQQGDFKQASKAPKDAKSKGGGSSDLGGLGSIASSFLKDTFGIGDWLPDLSNNPWLKSADAAVGAFLPMLMGDAGTGSGGGAGGTGGGLSLDGLLSGVTSNAPFGIPDVQAPPMPDGTQHLGAGGPTMPGPPVTIDASTNIQGNVGWSADEVEQRRRRNEQRAIPRVPVGS
jgi:phage-related minor tail protein